MLRFYGFTCFVPPMGMLVHFSLIDPVLHLVATERHTSGRTTPGRLHKLNPRGE